MKIVDRLFQYIGIAVTIFFLAGAFGVGDFVLMWSPHRIGCIEL